MTTRPPRRETCLPVDGWYCHAGQDVVALAHTHAEIGLAHTHTHHGVVASAYWGIDGAWDVKSKAMNDTNQTSARTLTRTHILTHARTHGSK